jgi:hypothetical protein
MSIYLLQCFTLINFQPVIILIVWKLGFFMLDMCLLFCSDTFVTKSSLLRKDSWEPLSSLYAGFMILQWAWVWRLIRRSNATVALSHVGNQRGHKLKEEERGKYSTSRSYLLLDCPLSDVELKNKVSEMHLVWWTVDPLQNTLRHWDT